MREKFWGYFPLNESDFKEIMEDSYIILDTNILLNFYRYSAGTKDKLIKILEDKKERLFLHEIVLKEFFRNRYSLINEHCNVKNKIESHLEKIKKDFKCELNGYRHMYLDKEKLEKYMDSFEKNIKKELDKCDIINFQEEDPILNQILDLFENKLIYDFDDKTKAKEAENAENRYQNNIPPGYEDSKKKQDINSDFPNDVYKKYNDYFIWKQIIEFSKEHSKNIIFITDDNKEDWFRKNRGEKIGPREELLNEFYRETGRKIYIYNTNSFFNVVDSESNILTKEMIEEIEEISEYDHKIRLRPKSNFDNTVLDGNRLIEILRNRNLIAHNIDSDNNSYSNNNFLRISRLDRLYNEIVTIENEIDMNEMKLSELTNLLNDKELDNREIFDIMLKIKKIENILLILKDRRNNVSELVDYD